MVMRRFIPVFLLAILCTSVTTGCLVQTRPQRTVVRERRSCPPAYHWEDGDCVHNGRGHGRGHDKHKDHRR